MNEVVPPRPVVLAILDGWGDREQCEMNAICQATTPNLDRLNQTGPRALIDASELEVGLPSGQMGNSEVGHMNLGAGRVVQQDLPRIDKALDEGRLTGGRPVRGLCRGPAGKRRRGASAGPAFARRGPFSSRPYGGARQRAAGRRRAGQGARLSSTAGIRRRAARSIIVKRFESATEAPVATDHGPLLCDGPGQALGALGAGLPDPGHGPGRRPRAESAADPHQAIEQAYEAGLGDEFVPPTAHRRLRRHGRRRRPPHGELPGRPGAPASSRRSWTPPSTASHGTGPSALPPPSAW